MDNNFLIEMTDLPVTGGLTGDPSVLHCVEDFLSKESYLQKVNQLVQEDGCVIEYLSLVDCLMVQLLPHFEDACLAFYEGNGKPLANLHPAETIEAIDREIVMALEILISKEWPTWDDFKSNFKAEIKWEPL
jgi:hypothetical protein